MSNRMGARAQGGEAARVPAGRLRLVLFVPVAVAVALLAVALPAQASFHFMSIREVYPGSVAQPESSYVELQMYAANQELVAGHGVDLYNASGGVIDANGGATGTTLEFAGNLPGPSVNQQTILIGDTGVQAAFPGVTPDLSNTAFNIPAAGGAACWAGTIDCVAWGSFTDTPPPTVGTPVDQGGGIPNGMAIRRKITGGSCTNLLDASDDTNDSASDFADSSPAPVAYTTVPTPPACTPPAQPPTAMIGTKPAGFTQETSASFSFTSEPPGATFACRIDAEEFASCTSPKTYAGPLSEASHTFQVKATNGNGTGQPASYTWTIDKTAPTASISSHPADPSPGATASFKYSSNESNSTFKCRLSPTEVSFTSCLQTGKTYNSLADGEYTFEVLAIDRAGNAQSELTPTTFHWTVNNTVPDTTAPETTIKSHPPDPSDSSTASFTYASNEPGSTFECMLDSGGFLACPAGGITYMGLGNGPHTFQVRAIDPSNNTDPSPAGYSFEVVLGGTPLPTPSGNGPPPETRLSGKPLTKTHDRTPTFRFRSSTSGATFQCKLDGGPFKACRSPFTTKVLSFRRHTLKVRAVLAGIVDPTPAKIKFWIVRP